MAAEDVLPLTAAAIREEEREEDVNKGAAASMTRAVTVLEPLAQREDDLGEMTRAMLGVIAYASVILHTTGSTAADGKQLINKMALGIGDGGLTVRDVIAVGAFIQQSRDVHLHSVAFAQNLKLLFPGAPDDEYEMRMPKVLVLNNGGGDEKEGDAEEEREMNDLFAAAKTATQEALYDLAHVDVCPPASMGRNLARLCKAAIACGVDAPLTEPAHAAIGMHFLERASGGERRWRHSLTERDPFQLFLGAANAHSIALSAEAHRAAAAANRKAEAANKKADTALAMSASSAEALHHTQQWLKSAHALAHLAIKKAGDSVGAKVKDVAEGMKQLALEACADAREKGRRAQEEAEARAEAEKEQAKVETVPMPYSDGEDEDEDGVAF